MYIILKKAVYNHHFIYKCQISMLSLNSVLILSRVEVSKWNI